MQVSDEQALAATMDHFRFNDRYQVGREKIREFAQAVQDYHPAHWDVARAAEYGHDDLIAPLTFISIVGLLTQTEFFEQMLPEYDLSQVLQTEQDLRFHRPLQAGDELAVDIHLHSLREAFGSNILTTRNVISDQNNVTVLTGYTQLAGRSSASSEHKKLAEVAAKLMRHTTEDRPKRSGKSHEAPPESPDPSTRPKSRRSDAIAFESIRVGDELPPRMVELTRGDLVNYAGVVGDPNPVHWSSEIASVAGLVDVAAHGMLTMGLGAGFITNWTKDPTTVLDYGVRFTSPVYVSASQPSTVVYRGKVKSLDSATRTATIAITAQYAERKIFGRALATVQLA